MKIETIGDTIFTIIGIFILSFPILYFLYYIFLGIFYKIKEKRADVNTLKVYINNEYIELRKAYTNKFLKKIKLKKLILDNTLYLNRLKFNEFFGLNPYSLNIYLDNIEKLNINSIEYPNVRSLNLYFYENKYKNTTSNDYNHYINFNKVQTLGLFFEDNIPGKLDLKKFFEYNKKKFNIDNIVLDTLRIDGIDEAVFVEDLKLKVKYGIKFQYINKLRLNTCIYKYNIKLIDILNVKKLDLDNFFQLTEKIGTLKIENVTTTKNYIYRNVEELILSNINIDNNILKIKNCHNVSIADLTTKEDKIVIDNSEYITFGINNLKSNILIKGSYHAKLTCYVNPDNYIYLSNFFDRIELINSKIEELGFVILSNNLEDFLNIYDKLLLLYKYKEKVNVDIENITLFVYKFEDKNTLEIAEQLEYIYNNNNNYENIYNETIIYCKKCLKNLLDNKKYKIIHQLPSNTFLVDIPKFKKLIRKERFKINEL